VEEQRKRNDVDLTRGVRISSWAGSRVRVRTAHEGRGRRAGWVARLEGLDISHTFARVFLEAASSRAVSGPGYGDRPSIYLLDDGRYEANSARAGRVAFVVEGGGARRVKIPDMIELFRAESPVDYGVVRALVDGKRIHQARSKAMELANPDERASAYQMILASALGGELRRALPDISGTPDQVEWCQDLRAAAFHTLGDALFERADRARVRALADALSARTDARWWIRNRRDLKTYRGLALALER
jgi:hypothetical protein